MAICSDCGKEYGNSRCGIATWHKGKCDVCKKASSITEARDFGYFSKYIYKLKKLVDKETKAKSRIKKQQSSAKLWKKASTAMQEYYRSLGLKCAICPRPQKVIHHFMPWGRSIMLRFDETNFVPLCTECHCKFHAGDIETHYDIRQAMSAKYGADWEASLIRVSHVEYKQSTQQLREYLNGIIDKYNNLKNIIN